MKTITKFLKNAFTLTIFILTVSAADATAATFTVTNANNAGAGSLRDAVTQANANGQADTINFDPAVFSSAQTITLASEIQITGDGTTTTGVFRPSNGIVYMKNSSVSGDADIYLVYGVAGDKPVAGDWNSDGIDSIGIYRNGVF